MAATAAVIAALAIGAGTAVYGGIKASKAKKAAEENAKNRPVYQIPQSEYDTLDLLNNRASQGLSDNTLQYYKQNQDRALTSSINAILQGGGSPNNISSVLDRYNDANGRIALANDQQQVQNIYGLIAQRQRMADYGDKQFQINQYAPWADKAAQLAQERAQGQGMVAAGLNTAASGVSTYASTLGRKKNTTDDTQPKVSNTPTISSVPASVNSVAGGGNYALSPLMNSATFGRYDPSVNTQGQPFGMQNPNNLYYGYDMSKLSPSEYQTVMTLMNNY